MISNVAKMYFLPDVDLNWSKREKNSNMHANAVTKTTMGISKMFVILCAPIPLVVMISHKIIGRNGHTKSNGLSTFWDRARTQIGICINAVTDMEIEITCNK